MEKGDFEIFKEKVIIPYLAELKKLDSMRCLSINYNAVDNIYKYYQSLRNVVKKIYMVKGTKALDRHKVASACVYGVLRSKIIRVNKNIPNLPPHFLMANEYFAVNIGINVVEMYKQSDGDQFSEYEIILPVSYHTKDEIDNVFLYELCAGLYNQNVKKHFDIFAYSIIFFQLEDKTDFLLGFRHENE